MPSTSGLLLATASLVLNGALADQSSTGALLKFPFVQADNPLYNESWEVHPSEFGYHDYGGKRVGFLVLPFNTSYHYECHAEPYKQSEYINYVREWNPTDSDETWLMLIDRGDCYFVTKVELAQSYGAAAVIVLDTTHESDAIDMFPPDGWQDDISIPSVMLDHTHSRTLMEALGVSGWNYGDSMRYPSADALNWTVGWLEYGLPRPDDRVEYELWSSANDPDAKKFRHNWKNAGLCVQTIFFQKLYSKKK